MWAPNFLPELFFEIYFKKGLTNPPENAAAFAAY